MNAAEGKSPVSANGDQEIELVLITGLSGSGKTVALHALEDLDFYCVDNLPADILPHFVDNIISNRERYHRVALGIDARNRERSLADLPRQLQAAADKGVRCTVVFLTTDERTLLKRFSETRRRHPLTAESGALPEALAREQAVLAGLKQRADFVLDTTESSIHELRGQIWKLVQRTPGTPLSLVLQSFAFKRGIPQDLDFCFDARCLPNPYWELSLRQHNGLEKPVQAWLQGHREVRQMQQDIGTFIQRWLPYFEDSQRSYVTLGIGCTGGRHRSVYLIQRLASELQDTGRQVTVHHRELA